MILQVNDGYGVQLRDSPVFAEFPQACAVTVGQLRGSDL